MAPAATAGVRRADDTLVFEGALVREASAGVWAQLQPLLAGTRRLDLRSVSAVDSAGLALLAEIAGRHGVEAVIGTPPGLSELRDAYRLDDSLDYAG